MLSTSAFFCFHYENGYVYTLRNMLSMPSSLQETMAAIAAERGYEVAQHVKGSGRYEYATLTKLGVRYFMKAGVNAQVDFDEVCLLHNLQREVWWATVVQAIDKVRILPFTSPFIVETNIEADDAKNAEVGWIIFEYEEGEVLSGTSIWNTGTVQKEWQPSQLERFVAIIPKLTETLAALDSISPDAIKDFPIPASPPHSPHQDPVLPETMVHVIRENELLPDELVDEALVISQQPVPERHVLGQGDFDVSHLFIRPDTTVVISDNEFAGWYVPHDSLTYCLHRIWANRHKPALAKQLLSHYVTTYVPGDKEGRQKFWDEFTRVMAPRLLRGSYYDFSRHKEPATAPGYRMRQEILTALLTKNYASLLAS